MAKVIDAIFENGVFKPLNDIKIKEHEKVVSLDEWQNKFNCIIEKLHKKAAQYSYEEMTSDLRGALP